MNKSIVRFVTGRILMLLGLLMLAPLTVSFIYREAPVYKISFGAAIAASFLLGLLLSFKKPASTRFYTREGLVICSLIWVLMSLLGALPLRLSGEFPTLIDAFFEISSGFTTTGASVATNVEGLQRSSLFWRSFTHLIGGMGVLVFVLALMPATNADNVHIMKAEVPGPAFGKLVSSLRATARILYLMYMAMTAVLVAALLAAGMPLFDALCHAFGAAGTGGFGIKNTSVLWYNSARVDYILGIGMLAFGVNFNLYYLLLLRKVCAFLRDEELRAYLLIVLGAMAVICLDVHRLYDNHGRMVRDVFFTVSSIITTTGYSTADYGQWPLLSHVILLLLMFCGAMAGSTAGGLKVSRVVLYAKTARAEFRRQREPGRIVPVVFNGKPISREAQRSLFGYLCIYLTAFLFFLLVTSLDAPDFLSAFSAVAATFNNIGPGLSVVGPTGSYASFSLLTKLMLSLSMIAGRLEIWPMVILFSRKTWRKV